MPFSLTPDLFQHPHVALNHKKSPGGQEGEATGVYERSFMRNYLFYLYHMKKDAQGYGGQKTKKLKN
jgi:hypothetical protein